MMNNKAVICMIAALSIMLSVGAADSVMNCDSLAMMCAIYPDFVNKTIQCHGSCITVEGETYAQVIYLSSKNAKRNRSIKFHPIN